MKKLLIILTVINFSSSSIAALEPTENPMKKSLYVVATSHLDTQWRWTIRQTIEEYIPSTLDDNFKLIEAYPHYTFSFEGAFRYMLMKEYYPDKYAKLKEYIAQGRWRVAGSWVDAVDVNIPSPESLIRQALYGNGYFQKEFGKQSLDIFLPDCFGFGYALPTIAKHCGIKSFSTQKLTWGSSVGAPFNIGIWRGVSGACLFAGLNPGNYVSQIRGDLSSDSAAVAAVNNFGDSTEVYVGYKYFGTGDIGGSPDEESVKWLEKSIAGQGPLTVISSSSDTLATVFSGAEVEKLPYYTGELLMTDHGTGCYTSQAAMKRWNRKNELIADAAERAAVIADIIGAAEYPKEDFRQHWIRFLWHQFHDDLTGTSIPQAYEFSWNDELLTMKGFAGILEHSIVAIGQTMDTQTEGIPLLVYNPLSFEREDIVEGIVEFGKKPIAVKVFNPQGGEVPSQFEIIDDTKIKVIFPAKVPSIGISVYEVRPAEEGYKGNSEVQTGENFLENTYYRVKVSDQGNVYSIFDKLADKEMLSKPIALQLLEDIPEEWAAWEIDYADMMAAPKAVVGGEAEITIGENGPVKVTLEIKRHYGASDFLQTISLFAGEAGRQIVFDNEIDWYERATLLKAAFPASVANDSVTYDLGCGTIKRGVNTAKLYEVPGQQWADISTENNHYGMAVLNDGKYGWDHPDKNTIRLTLIHTPGISSPRWEWVGDQRTQDFGHHRFKYAVMGHKGSWQDGGIPAEAAKLNQPLLAFQSEKHPGIMGKALSMLEVEDYIKGRPYPTKGILVKSVKKAEDSDEYIVRLQECEGKNIHNARLMFNWNLQNAFTSNGMEISTGNLLEESQNPEYSFRNYEIKSTGLKVKKPDLKLPKIKSEILILPYNLDGISGDDDYSDGDVDGEGNTISAELIPEKIVHNEVEYTIGPQTPGVLNTVKCQGQTIKITKGERRKLNLLVTSTGKPCIAEFKIGKRTLICNIPEYRRKIGQWNNRVINGKITDDKDNILPAYIDPITVVWTGTHLHNKDKGNIAYEYSNLFLLSFDLNKKDSQIVLPNNLNIKVFAATIVSDIPPKVKPIQSLMDNENNAFTLIEAQPDNFVDRAVVKMSSPFAGAEIHYTLGGTNPDLSSPVYTEPLEITQTTTICARAFVAGMNDEHITKLTVNKLVPLEAVEAPDLQSGIACKYYEGDWEKLPDFDKLEVKQQSVMDTIAFPEYISKEYFGLKFTGYIQVPQDEVYKFYCMSDDGSVLFIGDNKVIDNDGVHGAWEEPGEIALKAGLHPITVVMFQRKRGKALQVSIESQDLKKQVIGKGMLWH